MDFDRALEKLSNMSPDELEAMLREAMVESGIEVKDEPCRFIWKKLEAEDCEIDIDKI